MTRNAKHAPPGDDPRAVIAWGLLQAPSALRGQLHPGFSRYGAPAVTGSAAPVQPGDLLAGKFRVERVLGQGGMGVVVAAIHEQLDQRVALKFLHGEAAQRRDVAERFVREARAAARIQSEHVARVLDVGTLPTGVPFLVMEYLAGRDLASLLAKAGRLPIDTALDYVLQACEAIAEAHAVGIVHRDLKPENLFLTRRADGSSLVKVIDFGISKTMTHHDHLQKELTATVGLLGSPFYMSPEQVKSAKTVDARADIWAIGVILHELLSGRPPFEAPSLYGLFQAIDQMPATPLRRLRTDVPELVESAVLRCLEKEPVLRWPTVPALVEALAPAAPRVSAVSIERIKRLAFGPVGGAATSFTALLPAPKSDPEPPTPVRPPRTPALIEDLPTQVLPGTAAGWSTAADTMVSPPSPPPRSVRAWLAAGGAVAVAAAAVVTLVVARSSAPASSPSASSATPSAATARPSEETEPAGSAPSPDVPTPGPSASVTPKRQGSAASSGGRPQQAAPTGSQAAPRRVRWE